MIATTIKQSKKLIELGIDVNSADMHWQYIEEDNGQLQWFYFPKDFSINENESIPAWSLSALIELIPNKISISDDLYYVCYKRNSAELRGPITWNGHQKTKIFKADNILDAVFEMVCYLLENKLIK